MKWIALLLLFALPVFGDVNPEPQKFAVTVTITYNAISLEEAAKLEAEVKKEHPKACEVKVSVGEIRANHAIEMDTISLAPGRFWINPTWR